MSKLTKVQAKKRLDEIALLINPTGEHREHR